jgi:hypothetical protein
MNAIAEPLRALSVPIDSLNLDPANARMHGEKNMAAIKASLAQFGQRKPIVVQRKGMVVRAGNGTVQAAKALGWTEIAAVVIDDDNATAAQFAIADNRTAELAEWDDDILAFELAKYSDLASAMAFDVSDDDEDSLSYIDVEDFEFKPVKQVWVIGLTSLEDVADKAVELLEGLGLKVARRERR